MVGIKSIWDKDNEIMRKTYYKMCLLRYCVTDTFYNRYFDHRAKYGSMIEIPIYLSTASNYVTE